MNDLVKDCRITGRQGQCNRRDIMVQEQYQTELVKVQQNVLRLGELANLAIKDSVEALDRKSVV